MWCDNCLLLLPLRAGAIAWAVIISLYSVVGGIVLFKYGQFLFFNYPEWQIYGGIAMAVGAVAVLNIFALSNRSYVWARACNFLWPFVVVISLIRCIIMMIELKRGEDNILWECQNGGQLWTASAQAGYGDGSTLPSGFCSAGISSIVTAFTAGLIVDLLFQFYMFFLNWRFTKRLEHYSNMKGPFGNGYYA